MQPEVSLLCSQASATCPYPEPDEYSGRKMYFNNIFHLGLVLPKGLFSSYFSTTVLYAFLFYRYAPLAYFIRLDLITLIFFEYKYEVLIIQGFPPYCHFSLLNLHVFLSIQCWNTLNVRRQVSHPYKIRFVSCYNGCTSTIVAMLLGTEVSHLPVSKELPNEVLI